jgi:hypothetical protein
VFDWVTLSLCVKEVADVSVPCTDGVTVTREEPDALCREEGVTVWHGDAAADSLGDSVGPRVTLPDTVAEVV